MGLVSFFYIDNHVRDIRTFVVVLQLSLSCSALCRRRILIRFVSKLDYDIEYMGSRSILLDIKCMFKTAKLAFTHEDER